MPATTSTMHVSHSHCRLAVIPSCSHFKPASHRPQTPPPLLPAGKLSARKVVRCVRRPATGITAHSLQPSPRLRVRCALAGRRRRATLAYEQPRANMTPSIKPEVHDVPLRRQSRAEPQQMITRTKNLVKIGSTVPKTRSRTDKHRQTDTLVTILGSPIGGLVIAALNEHSVLVRFHCKVTARLSNQNSTDTTTQLPLLLETNNWKYERLLWRRSAIQVLTDVVSTRFCTQHFISNQQTATTPVNVKRSSITITLLIQR